LKIDLNCLKSNFWELFQEFWPKN